MVEFQVTNHTKVLKLLQQEIGPRRYYLHNQIGGVGWSIRLNQGFNTVIIDNDQLATVILLKL